ncbi:MAG: DUF2268 domain-containing putative Zn-dependent protease [Candidatus Magasanikbacteria bacterium]
MKNIHLHILQANPLLKPYNTRLKKEFDLVLKQISKYLDTKNVDILVMEDGTRVGSAVETRIINDNVLAVTFDTKHKKFKKYLKQYVRRPVSNDLYLLSIYQKFGFPKTLLEEILLHGVALNFEKTITKFALTENFELNKNEVEDLINKNKRFFKLKDYNPAKWFHNPKSKPAYIGRVIGYFLVKNYLQKNKETKLEDLLKISQKQLAKLIQIKK